VTVSYYPPGASKWNPIEHWLFGEVSKNRAGEPLESYEKILNYMRTTKTTTGLKVKAYLVPKHYAKGVKVSDDEMNLACSPKVDPAVMRVHRPRDGSGRSLDEAEET
jgi:hypothetical protein